MGYKVKGNAGPILESVRFEFDPATAELVKETVWGGSTRAIEGQATDLRNRNLAFHSILEETGRGQTIQRTPVFNKGESLDLLVRYEIATEFLEQDLFRHKTVSDAADAYDLAAADGADTFRAAAEEAVGAKLSTSNTVLGRVIEHLRKGVTGFEREYIVLRRSRRIPFNGPAINAIGGLPQVAILEGRLIYSTEQLGVPAAVAFSLPNLNDLPQSDWADAQWGWRRRPSSVIFDGGWIEQSSEFILAEWSLLAYEVATGAASW